MDLKLKDKVVLITASSKGIGRATAELFIKEGARVAISSSNESNLKSAVDEIKRSFNYEPFWNICDLNNPKEIQNTYNLVKDHLGDVDILVNNCGGPAPGLFEDLTDNKWEHGYEQVLMSAVRFSRLVLPSMKSRRWGRIINITSLSVKQPVLNLMLSNSFRSALTAFAKTLSQQVGEYNVTVNNVAPGFTLTGRLYELAVERAKTSGSSHEHILAEMANEVPLKRLGKPDEVGAMIVYLASEQANYITGQTIAVDGGVIKSTY
ncbi:MAG: SDR family oxidoreductase [Melioribacteraceae bacterium]|nr:SDR family oxidoreductase [Melioribacteraceae bacterium]